MKHSNAQTLVFFALIASLFSACQLDTRAGMKEQDEKQVIRKQVATLQATTADVNSRFQDLEDDVRKTNGRVEVLETKMQQSQAQSQQRADREAQAIEAKMKDNDTAYREEFSKLHAEIDALKAQAAAAQAAQAAAAANEAASAKKDPFTSAEEKYEKKEYKEAILDYERYRKANAKGSHFAAATFKIGSSFQELGMNEEARAFYEEVIAKFPKSKDAAKAKTKLSKLKAKK